MSVKDLLGVLDGWTQLSIYNVINNEVIYDDLAMVLEDGLKYENCENVLFNEEHGEILKKTVMEVHAEGKEALKIEVM